MAENDDVLAHTVTDAAGGFDSGRLQGGDAYELVVEQPMSYVCTFHPAMRATIGIEG